MNILGNTFLLIIIYIEKKVRAFKRRYAYVRTLKKLMMARKNLRTSVPSFITSVLLQVSGKKMKAIKILNSSFTTNIGSKFGKVDKSKRNLANSIAKIHIDYVAWRTEWLLVHVYTLYVFQTYTRFQKPYLIGAFLQLRFSKQTQKSFD